MTIGIGGWGSRRKPMAVVRAICRSDLDRPDHRRLRRPRRRPAVRHRQGAQGRVRLRHARLHRARSALAGRPPARPRRGDGGRRGHVLPRPAGGGVAGPLPAHPRRPRLRRPHHQPRTCAWSAPPTARAAPTSPTRPTPTSSWSPCRRSTSMPPSSTPTGPTPPATARSSSPDPFFDPLFLGAAERRFMTTERIVENGALADEGHPLSTVPIHRMLTDGVAETPRRRALHRQPTRLRARRGVPEGVRGGGRRPGRVGGLRRPLRPRRRGRVPGPGRGAPGADERRRASPEPSSASSPAPTPGAEPARSWPARSAPSPRSAPGWPSSPSPPTSSSPTARPR